MVYVVPYIVDVTSPVSVTGSLDFSGPGGGRHLGVCFGKESGSESEQEPFYPY